MFSPQEMEQAGFIRKSGGAVQSASSLNTGAEPPVRLMINRLENEINQLSGTVDVLIDRLAPVLAGQRAVPTNETCKDRASPGDAPITLSVEEAVIRIKDVTERVLLVLSRIEI